MSFAQRLVVGTVVILILAVMILLSGAESTLRRDLEGDIARSLEREALLIREALPADSAGWDEAVHRLSAQNGHRITLVDRTGRVRFPTPSRTMRAAPRCARRSTGSPGPRRG